MNKRRTIVALLMLTMSFSAFASVKYYRSTTNIPMVEMMVNMMVAMGVLDRVPVGGYGAYPISYSPYSSWGNYGGSPLGATPWGGSPYSGSPWGGSPYGTSPWGGSPYSGSPWGGSPYGVSPWGGSPYSGSPWGSSPWGGSPYSGSPWGGSPWGGSPYSGSPWGGSPWGVSPYRGSSWGGSPYRGSTWGPTRYRGAPYRGSSYRGSPYRGSPYAGLPWGASPFAIGPGRSGYNNHRYRPSAYSQRWGPRYPRVAYAPGRYPASAFPRRISNPLFAESDFCPSGLCDRTQVKKALEGVWKNESGETLAIKDNRFDWSDGGERQLSGTMHATRKELVATVDDYNKEIRYRYNIRNNQMTTRDDKGMTRVFHRMPEDKGEKL